MEPIDYLRAPLRRWPVLVAITIFVVVLAAVPNVEPITVRGKKFQYLLTGNEVGEDSHR